MDLELVYALWRLGRYPSERLPDLAGDLMVEGCDGPAVFHLATFHRPSREEVGAAFDRVLEELGFPVPSQGDCRRLVARAVARDVLLRRVDPEEGARDLWGLLGDLSPDSGFCSCFCGSLPRPTPDELAWKVLVDS